MTVESASFRDPGKLLEHLGVSRPEEIDVEAIAQFCGATIRYEPIEGSEARLLGYGEKAIITVKRASSRGRQRFSAAHELGHWMSDRRRLAFECDEKVFATQWTGNSRERRANRYAVDLLLPASMFEPLARSRPIVLETARELAGAFQTSLTATTIRLVEFGSFPALVVCSNTQGRREWFIRGPGVPDDLWPVEQPGSESLAYELRRSGSRPRGPVEVCAGQWLSHEDADRYAVVEDSVKITPEHVLSLIWWKDERQLLDLDRED